MKTRARIAMAVLAGVALAGAGGGTMAAASAHPAAAPHTTAITATAAVARTAAPAASRLTWHPLHLLNDWTAASGRYYGVPSYAIQNGILYLSGILQAHPTTGSEFAVLPPGARPTHFLWMLYYNFGGAGANLIANMEIQPDGGMFIYGSGHGPILSPSLQAISFPLSS